MPSTPSRSATRLRKKITFAHQRPSMKLSDHLFEIPRHRYSSQRIARTPEEIVRTDKGPQRGGNEGTPRNTTEACRTSHSPHHGQCYSASRVTIAEGRRFISGRADTDRKPGKQRLGPSKKKLTSLKKKILLDRAKRWRDLEDSQRSAASITSTNIRDPSTSSDDVRLAQPDAQTWHVVIRNLVEEEDVQDDEEHAEIEKDVYRMARPYGSVLCVRVPRTGEPGLGIAVITFGTSAEAHAAQESLAGRMVGGKPLVAELGAPPLSSPGMKASSDTGGNDEHPAVFRTELSTSEELACEYGTNQPGAWQVIAKNLVHCEDVLDDEDFTAVFEDIAEMAEEYGRVVDLRMVKSFCRFDSIDSCAIRNDIDVVVSFAAEGEAIACARGFDGQIIAGHVVAARVTPLLTSTSPMDVSTMKERSIASSTHQTERLSQGTHLGDTNTVSRQGVSGRYPHWTVVVGNVVDDQDVGEDTDDDFAQIRSDIEDMLQCYGQPLKLCIPRTQDECALGSAVGEAVAIFGSDREARACASGLDGRCVAGKRLTTRLAEVPVTSSHTCGLLPLSNGQELSDVSITRIHGDLSRDLLEIRSGLPPDEEHDRRDENNNSQASDCVSESQAACCRVKEEEICPKGHTDSRYEREPNSAQFGPTAKRVPNKYKDISGLQKPPLMSGIDQPRSYIVSEPDPEIDGIVFAMLQLLIKYQDRARLQDSANARSRRRVVMGLREVLRGIRAKKVRLVIVAPNVDAMQGKGGLDDKVSEIIDAAQDCDTPVVFSLSKRKMGKALGKAVKISVVGVYSFDGANEEQKKLMRRLTAIETG